MSGLFGANAVRSPLSDVPSFKARTAQQLEAIIENALLPDTFETARVTLQALRPITNVAGFMAEVRPEQLDQHTAGRVLGVLNAGATIHAVEYDEAGQRYLVRSELFEFLSVVAKKAFESSDRHANQAELEKIVGVALLPNLSHNAEVVLHYMHPMSEDRGFTAEIKLDEVSPEHIRTVRNTLNAGATLDRVQRAGKDAKHYYIHRDLYKTLALIRARTLMTDYGPPRIAAAAPEFGGSITQQSKAIEHLPDPQHQLPLGARQRGQRRRGRERARAAVAIPLRPAGGIAPRSGDIRARHRSGIRRGRGRQRSLHAGSPQQSGARRAADRA